MPEQKQQTEKPYFDGLMDILAYSAAPFFVGVLFGFAICTFFFLFGS